MDRVKILIIEILISIDQLAQTILCGAFYLVGLAPAPSADETISGIVGRRAFAGQKWARIAAVPIDRLFMLLGEAPGHCERSRGN